MTGLDLLLAVAGLAVTVLVVAGMILVTPRGAVDAFDDVIDSQGAEPSRCERPGLRGRAPSESGVGRVSATAMSDGWRRGQRGWPASFPVAQVPNASLWIALGGRAVAVMTGGSAHAYARAAFYAGLAAWAWEELVSGVNWVRRALGVGGLIYAVDRVAGSLRA
jgi:hypothetical protein